MLFRLHRHSLVVHTSAKLNLFLEVLGKRPDGYHELETLMVSLSIYDTLSFTLARSEGVELRCFPAGGRSDASKPTGDAADQTIPGGSDNLVVQAANLLRAHVGGRASRGVRIHLLKRIPAAAGLGGGSSDAAATLLALNEIWGLKLPAAELHGLACRLGSDVGFFLCGAPAAICRGRGEMVEPISMPLGLHFVVVRPRAGLSTATVYGECRPARRPKSAGPLIDSLKSGRVNRAVGHLHNALQVPAEKLCPEVRQLRTRFSRLSVLGHQMSGSGAGYFGVCAHRRQALSLSARLRGERLGSVFVAQCRL